MKWHFGPEQSALGNDIGVRSVSGMMIEQWVMNDLRSAGGRGPFNRVECCNTKLASISIPWASLSSHSSYSGAVDSKLS